MKTFYLIKLLSPFLFFLSVPRLLAAELAPQGFFPEVIGTLTQILFALGLFLWLARGVDRKKASSAFLKMSCVSKKVFDQGRWISVEQYLFDHHHIVVSHGMTPEECADWKRQAMEDAERDFSTRNIPMPAFRPLTTGRRTPARELLLQ